MEHRMLTFPYEMQDNKPSRRFSMKYALLLAVLAVGLVVSPVFAGPRHGQGAAKEAQQTQVQQAPQCQAGDASTTSVRARERKHKREHKQNQQPANPGNSVTQ
jgi:hypothetical protein